MTSTTQLLALFLLAACVSGVVTPLVGALAGRLRLTHQSGPSRLGGIALGFSCLVGLAAAVFWMDVGPGDPLVGVGLSLAALTILALGVYDDLRGATPAEKIAIQVMVAVATWTLGLRIDKFSTLGDPVVLEVWASLPLTVLWIVAVTNALNLIDGLDGLAAGVALIAVSLLFGFGWLDGDLLLCAAAVVLSGALIGFLVHNWNPATIFMGDSGSLLLGYLLAVVSIASTSKQLTMWALALPALALGLPLADTALAVVRRLRAGRSVASADASHIHHRLLRAGYTQRQVVLLLYGVCILLAAMAWTLKARRDPAMAVAIAAAGSGVFALMHLIGWPERLRRRTETTDTVARRARVREVRAAVSIDELWDATASALTRAGAVEASLELFTVDSTRWTLGSAAQRPRRSFAHRLSLVGGRHDYGRLSVVVPRDRDPERSFQRELELHLIVEAAIDALDTMPLARRMVVTRLPG